MKIVKKQAFQYQCCICLGCLLPSDRSVSSDCSKASMPRAGAGKCLNCSCPHLPKVCQREATPLFSFAQLLIIRAM